MVSWMFANVGFDTGRRLWMIEFYGPQGQWLGTTHAIAVEIVGGRAKQFEWHDEQGQFWHVRERIYPEGLVQIEQEPTTDPLLRPGRIKLMYERLPSSDYQPSGWAAIEYAYDLKTSRGFVEFLDGNGTLLARLADRWIVAEDVRRTTVGEYPHIRIHVEAVDCAVHASASVIVIAPRPAPTAAYNPALNTASVVPVTISPVIAGDWASTVH
jgi:hypothetical protein